LAQLQLGKQEPLAPHPSATFRDAGVVLTEFLDARAAPSSQWEADRAV
jgi:hypothetical protein